MIHSIEHKIDIDSTHHIHHTLLRMDTQEQVDYEALYRRERKKSEDLERYNTYLTAKISILESSNNKGEKDEVLLLMSIFHENQKQNYSKLIEMFGEEASEGIKIIDVKTREEVTNVSDLTKAGGSYKADCIISMNKTNTTYSISIKSKNGANPAILNHTPRTAKVFQKDGALHHCTNALDILMAEYISKRKNNEIGEDVKASRLQYLGDNDTKERFMEVLAYFAFDGTGKGDSACKANAVMYYHGDSVTFIKCCTLEEKKQYIRTILDKVVISLRDKGMPRKINDCCSLWVYEDHKPDGSIKHKGSLHIRLD